MDGSVGGFLRIFFCGFSCCILDVFCLLGPVRGVGLVLERYPPWLFPISGMCDWVQFIVVCIFRGLCWVLGGSFLAPGSVLVGGIGLLGIGLFRNRCGWVYVRGFCIFLFDPGFFLGFRMGLLCLGPVRSVIFVPKKKDPPPHGFPWEILSRNREGTFPI